MFLPNSSQQKGSGFGTDRADGRLRPFNRAPVARVELINPVSQGLPIVDGLTLDVGTPQQQYGCTGQQRCQDQNAWMSFPEVNEGNEE